jgi:predicted transcriptional regulator
MMDPKSTTITVRVSHELAEQLKEFADREERTLSQYCRIALKHHVDERLKSEKSVEKR